MNNPTANRRTLSNSIKKSLSVTQKKFYFVAIGSATLVLFSIISMWVMGEDLSVKSKQLSELNEVVGQIEIIKQEYTVNKNNIDELQIKLTSQEQLIQQLTTDNEQLRKDNEDLTKKYRERREALEKKRLNTIALNSDKTLITKPLGSNLPVKNFPEDSKLNGSKTIQTTNNINEIENAQPTGVFNASFYTPKCKGCSGKTTSGERATPGVTIAVDPRYWKLGTRFYVEGFGILIAQDTGGAIKGKNRVDICVSTTQEALRLGNKKLKYWVLEDN